MYVKYLNTDLNPDKITVSKEKLRKLLKWNTLKLALFTTLKLCTYLTLFENKGMKNI